MTLLTKLSYLLFPISAVALTLSYFLVFLSYFFNSDIIDVTIFAFTGISGWSFIVGIILWILKRSEQNILTGLQRKIRIVSLAAQVFLVALPPALYFAVLFFLP